jgi:hypothetical protein
VFSNNSDAQSYAIAFLIFILLLPACLSWFQPRVIFALARWSDSVPSATETPDGFYTRLYNELQARLEEKQLPFSVVGFGPRHLTSNRTIFGSNPVYLTVKYQHLTYYVYAAPAPGGVFVSTWLFSKYSFWEEFNPVKWFLFWKLFQMTLFQFDVLDLFHTVVHQTVTDLIDVYRAEEGLQPMSEYEKRPVLGSYYAKLKLGALPPAGYAAPMAQMPAPAGGVLPLQTDPIRTDAVRSPEDDFGLQGAASRPLA